MVSFSCENNASNSQAAVPHKAYVEDIPDEYDQNAMPEAPSPPSAAPAFGSQAQAPEAVNVFDFLVPETPNASRVELPAADEVMDDSEPERQLEQENENQHEPMNLGDDADISGAENQPSTDLVRVRFEDKNQSLTGLVEYGNEPVASGENAFQTPTPKAIEWKPQKEHKKDKKDHAEKKKDKKRKRLHVDTHDLSSREGDEVMTDAPPVLHSGLTGGLNKLLSRPSIFPPSPDYSGDAAEHSPGSPLKKTKHAKRSSRPRHRESLGSNFMSLISTKQSSRENSQDRRKKRKHRAHKSTERTTRKMLEYKPMANGTDDSSPGENQMIVYKPRAELLMSFVNKGPNSERGVSMNKALKRYHRERTSVGLALGKGDEEKELWRSLRMKKNDRGEIVLFM
ncbi:LYAR-type C2HC zinc finger protein [Rutstroemia sp. NJR-2017a BBW]|nr:LYAR-type C2HC zinc finger protein [Rutstroemia sp. NJR-2017a BBW]